MLLLLYGPPAVGKMTIGRAVCERTSFHLFHNHMTIEPLLETFGFGTPAFNVLNSEFRLRVLEEAARNDVDLLFAIVLALDCADDVRIAEHYASIFDDQVAFVELRADLDTRLQRNRTEHRLAHKASKRDLEWSDANVRELEQTWQMTSDHGPHLFADLFTRHPHLVVDTADRTVAESADVIAGWITALRA